MNFNRGYRFFLKVAFVYLVASVLLPFGGSSGFRTSQYLWTSGYGGPTISPLYRVLDFHWSFIYVRGAEVVPLPFPPSMMLPPDQDLVGIRASLLPEYWSWRPAPRSILFLQVGLIILGFLTIRMAKSARSIIPFFLGILSLSFLHLSAVSLDFTTPSYGLWISIFSTIFTTIAIERAP